MSYAHSFVGILPPARYDGTAWRHALVEESAGPEGIWTQIASITIPTDPTPQTPNGLNLTVSTATLEVGYYRFRFDDAAGTLSAYTDVLQSPGADAPSQLLPGGIDLERFKSILEITKDARDELLLGYLQDAVSFAAAYTRRQLLCLQDAAAPRVAVTFPLNGGRWARVPDARDILTVTVDEALVTDWVGYTQPTTEIGSPIALLRLPAIGERLTLVARFGFLTLPASLSGAIYAHAGRNYRERQAMFADTVDMGVGDGTGALYSYFRQLPPRVQAAYALWQLQTDWMSA